jgi:hypothetical protein
MKHLDFVHHVLDGAPELPVVIGRLVVVRGYEHLVSGLRGAFQKLLDILHRVVGDYVLTNQTPDDPIGTEKVVLRVGDNERSVTGRRVHVDPLMLDRNPSGLTIRTYQSTVLPVNGICMSPIALVAGLVPANCGTLDRHEITACNRAALVSAALGKMILAGCLVVPKEMVTRPHR